MIINNFNVKLFNLLNEMVYIVNLETNKTIFVNDAVNNNFKENKDFEFIHNSIFGNSKADLINLNFEPEDFIRINKTFKHKSKEYCPFVKISYFNNEKVIIYLLKSVTKGNIQEIFNDKNDEFIQIIDKNSEIYNYMSQLFNLISGSYDNFITINNQAKFKNYLKLLNSEDINYLGVLSIKMNNIDSFKLTGEKEENLNIQARQILEKFFRVNDIYTIEKNVFTVICENISKKIFYQKVQDFNTYVLDEEEFSFSVGFIWEDKVKDIYSIVEISNNLMEKAENSYNEKIKYGPVYFTMATMTSINDKAIEVIEDIEAYTAFQNSDIPYSAVLEKFYKKVSRLLDKDKNFVMTMLDINNFKSINEIYGYKKGNEILSLLNNILSTNVKDKGACAHFHSDVYYIFFESNSDEETIETLYNINKEVNDAFGEMNISLIYGVYRVEDINLPIEKMCERANYAHKNVKKEENSTNFIFYYKDIKDKFIYEQEVENVMHKALKDNEFKIYLQPKYDIFTMAINGAEALARWENAEKGFILPSKFVPIFEKNGFILKLDLFILEKACAIIKKRIEENKKVVPISVNMSKLHFQDRNFKYNILDIVEKYEIPTNLIEIEVTESLLMSDINKISNIIKELKEKGIKIAIDDFGTGYSSLSVLKDLDIDTLKIDGSFFKGFKENEKSELVLRHIVSLGNELKMKIVAEGVETKEEINYLKEINCSTVQGHYFSEALSLEEYEKLLDNE